MSTYLPSYAMIAEEVGIRWCRGIRPNGQTCYYNHRRGSFGDGFVHWAARTPTRSGIRSFLTLAARRAVDDGQPEWPFWRRYYHAQLLVSEWAHGLKIRFPASVTDKYRIALRAMLVNVDTWEPDREEAMTWATIRS